MDELDKWRKADVTRRSCDTNVSPREEMFKSSTDDRSKTNANRVHETLERHPQMRGVWCGCGLKYIYLLLESATESKQNE